MNKEKSMKWIIKFLMLSNVYLIVADLLVLAGKTKLQALHPPAVFFSLFMFCIACLIIKNKYWLLAFIFKALHTFALAIASKYFAESGEPYNLPGSSTFAVIVGIIFLFMSFFSFYKLLQIPDLVSQKYTYSWMQNLNNYLKKKKLH